MNIIEVIGFLALAACGVAVILIWIYFLNIDETKTKGK